MKEYLVVLFYIADEAQGEEISLAIEGWRKHFKEKFRLVVIGDNPHINGIEYMIVDRISEKDGEYRPHLDICNKLRLACTMYGDSYDGFIWASDDFFAVNDFTFADVIAPKYQDEEMPPTGDRHPNPWVRNLVKTRHLCDAEGYGIVNWITHLPLYFECEKLMSVIRDYDLTKDSYIVENIYFNKFVPEGKAEKLSINDRWKFGVYFTPLDICGLMNAFANKIWVCCSVNGWSESLATELKKHYGINTSL